MRNASNGSATRRRSLHRRQRKNSSLFIRQKLPIKSLILTPQKRTGPRLQRLQRRSTRNQTIQRRRSGAPLQPPKWIGDIRPGKRHQVLPRKLPLRQRHVRVAEQTPRRDGGHVVQLQHLLTGMSFIHSVIHFPFQKVPTHTHTYIHPHIHKSNQSTCISNLSTPHPQNADLWLYPSKSSVSLHGTPHLTVYHFGRKVGGHAFCSTCGVPVVNLLEQREGQLGEFFVDKIPVNARTLNGVDLGGVEVKRVDGKNRGQPYEEV